MSDTSRGRTGQLVRKLFELLIENPDGMRAAAALERLAQALPPTPYEAGSYASGVQRFGQIVRFATVPCVKAGWMVKNRGNWSATETGAAAFQHFTQGEDFYSEALRLYQIWRAAQGGEAIEEIEPEIEEDAPGRGAELAAVTFEQAEEQAWDEIERHLGGMEPYDLQQLVADLLKVMGYHIAWISPPGKDGGVDIVAHTDPLGTKLPRIKVQVKRRADRINVDGLRAFMAIVNDHDVGLFVSIGGFTRDAEEFARNQERRQVTLIDLDRLVGLWIEHWGKLSDAARRRLPLTPIYFLTPET